jgi:hypothetical protein
LWLYYGLDSEQAPPLALKFGQPAKKPDELPEAPVELAVPVAAAKPILSSANAPVLAVAADAVWVVAGTINNPTAAIPARTTNNPTVSLFTNMTK